MDRETRAPVVMTMQGLGQAIQQVTHPAFAVISAKGHMGNVALYGSDLKYQHYVRLRICPSVLTRENENDTHSSSQESYVEVDMSAHQWATFIHCINTDIGTQCTLVSCGDKPVVALPFPGDHTSRFTNEMDEKFAAAMFALSELRAVIAGEAISSEGRAQVDARMQTLQHDMGEGLKSVGERFDQHMHRTLAKAKIELSEYAVGTVTRMGLDEGRAGKLGLDDA